MRNWAGWAAAAVVAAGCEGPVAVVSTATVDERVGPDVVCAECKVTGGGQIEIGGSRVQFSVQAIPESGPAAGPGFGGVGVAAKGGVRFLELGGDERIDAQVDTILSCRRENGQLTATFSGSLGGADRFQATVVDGGEPADDLISFPTLAADEPVPVARGNIQVHALDRCAPTCVDGECEPQCPAGQCVFPEGPGVCEPCDEGPLPGGGAEGGTTPGGGTGGDGTGGDGATGGDGTAGGGTDGGGTDGTDGGGTDGTTPPDPFIPL